ncbi:tyrosine-type recombinase/integrase [Streptomyces prunicolor]|uniref:tyrosine-type recombinase/integrase n=1 Tax=Streptomyces prunicolor TaxID=67348 RepID=UPI003405B36B
MAERESADRDLSTLEVPQWGRVIKRDDPWEPFQLIDREGQVVRATTVFFMELQAAGRSTATIRSYAMDLLRWYRFLWLFGVDWDRATTREARDFMRWLQLADKPQRVHWRRQRGLKAGQAPSPPKRTVVRSTPGAPNLVTGKPTPGRKYAPTTAVHCETVLRSFYAFHREEGTGPMINPFPLDRRRRGSRANAHHNPMDPFKSDRKGRYRPKVPKKAPRRIPDELFNELFARLKYHRDRALLAFWVSTGARAEGLLLARQRDALPGQQLIGITLKGSREYRQVPASPDAFVWLRLSQEEEWRKGVLRGRNQPLWWTLRRPWRPLEYDAARAMFTRVNDLLGANWTLHDLRHTASYRMARDPLMPLTDVQWVLGHESLSTTQIYLPSDKDEVIESVRAFHARRANQTTPQPAPPAAGYNAASLDILFGKH